MSLKPLQVCPCCKSPSPVFFTESEVRDYHLCLSVDCGAAFLGAFHHLSLETEKSRYDLHHNDITQQGYIDFLQPLLDCVRQTPTGHALDFGAGPTNTISRLTANPKLQWSVYDKFYSDTPEVFQKKYDVIAASEVFEHLRDPVFELQRLKNCLKPDGVIWIMTSMYDPERISFGGWHYRRDPTHVVFYTRQSFRYLAKHCGLAEPVFVGERVVGLGYSRPALGF